MAQIQIFKAGRHVTMAGQELVFSDNDLATTAMMYNMGQYRAPLVLGHPSDDMPAYGWVDRLQANCGALFADVEQVDANFAAAVNAGRYKKISAAFHHPGSAQNPVPGCYSLRHVGFLGSQTPAVKGMQNPAFSDSRDGVIELAEAQVLLGQLTGRKFSAPSLYFSCPPGYTADPKALAVHRMALAYQEAHSVSYIEAVGACWEG